MAKKTGLVASTKAIDPTLDALFSASAGPIQAPSKSRYTRLLEKKQKEAPPQVRAFLKPTDDAEGDDEELSEISEELDDEDEDEHDAGEEDDNDEEDEEADDNESSPDSEVEDAVQPVIPTNLDEIAEAADAKPRKDRKRKRNVDNEDLEGKYLAELAKEEPAEPAGKRQREEPQAVEDSDEDMDKDDDDVTPVHESLVKETKASELEKAARTIFVANVASEAISSKSAKKKLLAHLSSHIGKDEPSIESIRFRSVAFSTGSMPKRAAYITKAVMDATTKSANAYVVYASAAAARKAAAELNGSEVLGRHIRLDNVAHPSPTDHRRCVFVGNLGFMDDETVLNQKGDGTTVEKKRNKVPSDVEEGLWRTFGTQGKVENVRVVRDPKTRVGKGFAYVQFYDTNDVESAILLNGKKFPPMLPRPMRVTRAKDPRKTALAQERSTARQVAVYGAAKRTSYQVKATPEQQSMAGRAGKLLGQAAAFQQQRKGAKGPRRDSRPNAMAGMKTPEQVVLEGRRASSRDALPKDLKGKKIKGKGGKPKHRGARRAADWRKKS